MVKIAGEAAPALFAFANMKGHPAPIAPLTIRTRLPQPCKALEYGEPLPTRSAHPLLLAGIRAGESAASPSRASRVVSRTVVTCIRDLVANASKPALHRVERCVRLPLRGQHRFARRMQIQGGTPLFPV
jgi:hypothetical protein